MSNHTQTDSGTVTWYTPPHILNAARGALGGIDLDPASDAFGNQAVRAARFFDEATDGLTRCWRARTVWVNPPYGRRNVPGEKKRYNQPLWSAKFLAEFEARHFEAGIMLVNASPGDAWWSGVFRAPGVWTCILDERLRFVDRDGNERRDPVAGNSLFYVGRAPWRFARYFAVFGRVLAPQSIVGGQ